MSHLSTLLLNQLRYGELDSVQETQAKAHLQDCAKCASRLRAQESNRTAFVMAPVPQAVREPAGRAPANDNKSWRWALLAVAAMLLVGFPILLNTSTTGADELVPMERTKGKHILLEAWLDTQDGPVLLDRDDRISPGDVLQLKFSTLDRPYVSFGGMDGAGIIELYGTVQAGHDMQIHRAPFALQMDQTPGEQRFYALFTQAAPQESTVRQAIQREAAPEGAVLRSIRFQKE
jgi:hypothetical protein